jgi:hypothetical protein
MPAEIFESLTTESSNEDRSIKESVSPSVSQLGHSEYGAGLSVSAPLRLNNLKTLCGQRNNLYLRKMG